MPALLFTGDLVLCSESAFNRVIVKRYVFMYVCLTRGLKANADKSRGMALDGD